MTAPDLKPCPFCRSRDIGLASHDAGVDYAFCNLCGAEGPCGDDPVALWNRRADLHDAAMAKAREALAAFEQWDRSGWTLGRTPEEAAKARAAALKGVRRKVRAALAALEKP